MHSPKIVLLPFLEVDSVCAVSCIDILAISDESHLVPGVKHVPLTLLAASEDTGGSMGPSREAGRPDAPRSHLLHVRGPWLGRGSSSEEASRTHPG